MINKKLIQDTILCIAFQTILTMVILGLFFNHGILKAMVEAIAIQVVTTIWGIIFLAIIFKK